jgi:hypothetical protein
MQSNVAAYLTYLGHVLQAHGQFEEAARCFDVAGNDRALLELVRSIRNANESGNGF